MEVQGLPGTLWVQSNLLPVSSFDREIDLTIVTQGLQIGISSIFILYHLIHLLVRRPKASRLQILNYATAIFFVSQGLLLTSLALQISKLFNGEFSQSILLQGSALGLALVGNLLSVSSFITGNDQSARMFYLLAMFLSGFQKTFTSPGALLNTFSTLAYLLSFSSEIWLQGRSSFEDQPSIDTAGPFGRLLFSWLNPLVTLGQAGSVDWKDLPKLPSDLVPEIAYSKLQRICIGNTSKLPGFWTLLWKMCPSEVMLSGIFEVIDIACKFSQPWILRLFVQNQNPYLMTILFFTVTILDSFAITQAAFYVKSSGTKLKAILVSRIFDKTLSPTAETKSSEVSTVSLVEVDTSRVDMFVAYMHATWSAPLQITLCLGSIALVLGWKSALAGSAAILLLLPLSNLCTRLLLRFQIQEMARKDSRLSLTSEIIKKIKTVKFFGYETSLEEKLDGKRKYEIKALQSLAWLSACLNVLMRSTPTAFSVAAFFAAQASHVELGGDKIFPALMIFSLLIYPMGMLPVVLSMWAAAKISYGRIQEFCVPDIQLDSPTANQADSPRVELSGVSFKWEGSENSLLEDVNLKVEKGELVCIAGNVGTGKSTVLGLLVNSAKPTTGTVTVIGRPAYMPQISWLMSGTVRENIIFGLPYDARLYNTVVKACALEEDFELMKHKDLTLIGSDGAGLSGGQKSRVMLARAVYSQADVYILDDPLASVDSKVHKHLVDNILGPKGLLADRLRIVTTSSKILMDLADHTYALARGTLTETTVDAVEIITEAEVIEVSETDQISADTAAVNSDKKAIVSVEALEDESLEDPEANHEIDDEKEQDGVITFHGHVPFSTYRRFFGYAGFLNWTMLIILTGLAYGSNVYSTYILRDIAVQESGSITAQLLYYAAACVLQGCFIFAWLIFAWFCCHRPTLARMHLQLVQGVLRSPMKFFQTTSVGDILNRFTNDLARSDMPLYGLLYGMINSAIRVVMSIAVLLVSSPPSLVYIIPFAWICLKLQNYYLQVSVELKRLETSSRSPILTNLQEVQAGITTIQVFGREEDFRQKNFKRLQRNLSAYVPMFSLEQWLAFRLTFLSAILQLLAASFLLFSKIDPNTIGLVMTYLLQISGSLAQTVVFRTQIESEMVPVQRILEYINNEREGDSLKSVKSITPPAAWPTKGHIEFKKYSASHIPGGPLALQNISVEIKPREKIAIVGRTGAGKSTFASSILRIFEAISGSIEVDGIDISKIQPSDIRSRIAIIPQDFQVFSGTVKENLDPFGRYDRSDLIRAVRDSHFDRGFTSPEAALDYQFNDGGSTLSNGQLQLLAIARAMLVESNVWILDEATAAVDHETEEIIYKTLEEQFQNKTTITIAHRLKTILKSDRVIVLDGGEILEIGSPKDLYNSGGRFADLMKEAGLTDKF